MSFSKLMSVLLGKKNTAGRTAPPRLRPLRFESLEQRALLSAATAGDFATLKALAESGQDYEITLTANIDAGWDSIRIAAGNISIDGGSFSITGSTSGRSYSLFYVTGGSLSVGSVTIDGLSNRYYYGAVFNQSGGSVAVNSGTTISNCSAYRGGVAYISGGTFTVGAGLTDDSEVRFSGNSADSGGVIYADGASATITVNGGTFSNNSATETAAG